MSNKKNKLVFRVGTGLAVTSMALALGTGCPKNEQHPNVNTVAPLETNSGGGEAPTDPVEPAAPATNNAGTNNGTTGATNGDTTAEAPELDPPKRVNTIPSKPQ